MLLSAPSVFATFMFAGRDTNFCTIHRFSSPFSFPVIELLQTHSRTVFGDNVFDNGFGHTSLGHNFRSLPMHFRQEFYS